MLTPACLADNFNMHLYGPVKWRTTLPSEKTGIYIITLPEISSHFVTLPQAPIDIAIVRTWLNRVPKLLLDGIRPSVSALAERISNFWIPDEIILYIGQTSAALTCRTKQFYGHRLGNRSPHKGGHWLKTLSNLDKLNIYWIEQDDAFALEQDMLNYFMKQVSEESRNNLFDPSLPLPFANLEIKIPSLRRKKHGIKNPALPRKPRS